MKITHVKNAQKDQGTCCKCNKEIKAGEPYSWIKPQYGTKRVVCGNCHFKNSDLTTSDKLSTVYAAQENAEDSVADWDGEDIEDLKSFVSDMASEIRDVADEYQSSCDAIKERFSESSTADECEEKAESLGSWADELESFDPADFDEADADFEEEVLKDVPDETEEQKKQRQEELYEKNEENKEKAIEEAREQWAEAARSEALDLIGNYPL